VKSRWVDVNAVRFKDIRRRMRPDEQNGYLGQLVEFVKLRCPDIFSEEAQKKILRMICYFLRSTLSLSVVNGWDSPAGKWLKRNGYPYWDIRDYRTVRPDWMPRSIAGQTHVFHLLHIVQHRSISPKAILHFLCNKGARNLIMNNIKVASDYRRCNRNFDVPTIWTYDPIDEVAYGGVHYNRARNIPDLASLPVLVPRQKKRPVDAARNEQLGSG